MTDSNVQVSDSGGTMQRLTGIAAPRPVDLAVLEPERVRGLVAWLAEGTPIVASAAADGRALRELPLAERFTSDRVPVLHRWNGGGILGIAPTGRPWSVWVFWEDDGSFAGHYVNLADEVHAVAEWARVDLVEARAWPLDDEWTTWRPPAEWTVPELPDTRLAREARRTTLPR